MSTAHEVYIARQPILDTQGVLYAYELLFRDLSRPFGKDVSELIIDDKEATVRVISNALNQFGIDNLLGNGVGFINANAAFIMDEALLNIPAQRFIIEVLEHVTITPALLERIVLLKSKGYRFALDDATFDEAFLAHFAPLLPYIDVLKIDITLTTSEIFAAKKELLAPYGFKILAEKVETLEEFEAYKALGCTLFQGYFFARPQILRQTSLDPSHQGLLRLTQLLNADAPIEAIEKAFEQEPAISLQLLRYLNSAAIESKSAIKSIRHAIMMLGKQPLKNWLLLIAFRSQEGSQNNPVFALAVMRSSMMQHIAMLHKRDKHFAAQASFVGLLSLIETILQSPLELILRELRVDACITDALQSHEKELGCYLKLAQALERIELREAQKIAMHLSIDFVALKNIVDGLYLQHSKN
ncbi:MAG: hypothetical protein KU37_12010 [Sulfuricurvum sp. PC08-66]|nr:MAG: hypothetical protein KU37_12010 [Sulfuricurvum sp. PC08-66]